MKKLTREWVKKAEGDRLVAVQSSRGRSATPLHDAVCFHCQQCAEKYFKALMQELALPITKTHDLGDLLAALRPHHPALSTLGRGLDFLSDFAVDPRYPGNWASKRQATAALRWMEKTRTAARHILGIRPLRKPRKKAP